MKNSQLLIQMTVKTNQESAINEIAERLAEYKGEFLNGVSFEGSEGAYFIILTQVEYPTLTSRIPLEG